MGLKALKKSASVYQEVYLTSRVDFSKYAFDPVGFIEKELGESLTDEQKCIANSVVCNRETNVQASHSVGKSHLSARIVLWWICCKGEGAFAISTGPTKRQVHQILWGELRKIYDRHREKIGGERGETFIRLPGNARAIGFTSRHTSSDSFQGLHERSLLIVIDESSGVSEEIDAGAQACVTSAENRLLRVGNPIRNNTAFHRACLRSAIRIPSWSHPNVSWAYELCSDNVHRLKPEVKKWILDKNGEVKPEEEWLSEYRSKIPGAVSVRWIEEARANYGESSLFWQTRVEAQFPTDDTDGIIPKSWLLQARDRYDANPQYWDDLAKGDIWRLGLDVGDGQDNHALAIWRGPVLYDVQIHATVGDRMDTVRAAEIAIAVIRRLGGDYRIAVDNTGVGAGTLASLLASGMMNASGCRFGDGADDRSLFLNRKSQLYWEFREGLRTGKVAIAPLGEKEDYIFQDLCATRYSINTKDQICCEAKEKTKARLKRSPDAEAVVIALENSMQLSAVYSHVVGADGLELGGVGELALLHQLFDGG